MTRGANGKLMMATALVALTLPSSALRAADGDGKVCVSRWNATSSYLIDAVKARLRDPSSFKHIQTVVGSLSAHGFYPAKMKYSYVDGGPRTVAIATAALDPTTCKARLL